MPTPLWSASGALWPSSRSWPRPVSRSPEQVRRQMVQEHLWPWSWCTSRASGHPALGADTGLGALPPQGCGVSCVGGGRLLRFNTLQPDGCFLRDPSSFYHCGGNKQLVAHLGETRVFFLLFIFVPPAVVSFFEGQSLPSGCWRRGLSFGG